MTPNDIKLYELFSKKELSEGCMIEYEGFTEKINKHGYVEDFGCYISENDLKHDISLNTCGTYNLLGHEPQLHDVFRVAKEKGIMFVDEKGIVFRKYPGGTSNISIPYNPTLPLLQQEESTKEQLISLFS